jgi:ABC-type antimicrobial peptide transport system permease subunit
MIVGVVTAAKLAGLDDQSGIPFVFRPRATAQDFTLVVRTKLSAANIVPLMREKLRSVDPGAPLFVTGSLEEKLNDLLASRFGTVRMLSAFAGVALVLAGIGLYGMLAYDVSQRTREIGIRAAVGASRVHIMALVLRQGVYRTGLGLAVGLVGSAYLNRFLALQLFEVKPADPLTFTMAPLLLLLIGLLACWLPAWRAAKVDPVVALRAE